VFTHSPGEITMLTHSAAAALLATARDKAAGKPLENNTRLELLENGDYGVRLHDTIVVTIHADETYTLNSGGWRTRSTKDRINVYSPAQLFQEKRQWFLTVAELSKTPFADGIRVDYKGDPVRKAAA
jgi:hypothetical protein